MSLAKTWLEYLETVETTLVPVEEMSAQDAGKILLQYFRGLKDPKVEIKDIAERFPSIDAGMLRKIITKFQNVGLLKTAGAGVYEINLRVLSKARIA